MSYNKDNHDCIKPIQSESLGINLINATIKGDENEVKRLIDLKAYVNYNNENTETSLIFAADTNNSVLIQQLLEAKADPDIVSYIPNGRTALISSLLPSKIDIEIVRSLVTPANVNLPIPELGGTALMVAATHDDEHVVELLINLKAKIDTQDLSGETALMKASREGKQKIVELLLKNNANTNLINEEGETALDIALLMNRDNIIKLFHQNVVEGVNVDSDKNINLTSSGESPNMDDL
jgi:ankyrin repeat protein